MANPIYKNPLDLATAIQSADNDVLDSQFGKGTPERKLAGALKYQPFKLDKKKYPDVEETPYGFIYNAGGRSITDLKAQNKALGYPLFDKTDGFSVTIGGDEVYYDDFDSAYKAAKGIK